LQFVYLKMKTETLFNISDLPYVVSKLYMFIGGIRKIMYVYFSEKNSGLVFAVINNPSDTSHEEILSPDEDAINKAAKLRTNPKQYEWLLESEVPFAEQKENIRELKLFDELQRSVLCLSFPSEHDGKSDLIYIFLKENQSNFIVSDTSVSLGQENKSLVAVLTHNHIQTMLSLRCQERISFLNFNERILKQFNYLKESNKENEKYKEATASLYLNYARKILDELSVESGMYIYTLTEDAIQKISKYGGEIHDLNEIILNAASLLTEMHTGRQEKNIVIDACYLNLKDIKKTILPLKEGESLSRMYHKAIAFLDRLEEAALITRQKQLELTGKNVGSSFKKPITAAAISYSIKLYDDRIVKLMLETFPERWPVIREHFKPIKNLLTARAEAILQQKKA